MVDNETYCTKNQNLYSSAYYNNNIALNPNHFCAEVCMAMITSLRKLDPRSYPAPRIKLFIVVPWALGAA